MGVASSLGAVVEQHAGAGLTLTEEGGRPHPGVGELEVLVQVVQPWGRERGYGVVTE